MKKCKVKNSKVTAAVFIILFTMVLSSCSYSAIGIPSWLTGGWKGSGYYKTTDDLSNEDIKSTTYYLTCSSEEYSLYYKEDGKEVSLSSATIAKDAFNFANRYSDIDLDYDEKFVDNTTYTYISGSQYVNQIKNSYSYTNTEGKSVDVEYELNYNFTQSSRDTAILYILMKSTVKVDGEVAKTYQLKSDNAISYPRLTRKTSSSNWSFIIHIYF